MKGTVRFKPRLNKMLKTGKAPIEATYSVRNQRVYYFPGENIYPAYWDDVSQRAIYLPVREARKKLPNIHPDLLLTEIEVNEINKKLSGVLSTIESIESDFIRRNIVFTSEDVKEALKSANNPITKKEEPKNFVFDFIEEYINDHSASREPGSLSVYKSVKNHLLAFQNEAGQKVRFDAMDYAFFQKFQNFLIKRTKTMKDGSVVPMLNNTTIAKALSTLKTLLGYARQQKIKVNDGYQTFRIKKDKLEVIALKEWEFQALLKLDLSANKRLDQVRDVFCFSCVTGMRYSDLYALSRNDIKRDVIEIVVKKTKSHLTIPLNSISYSILDKYKDLRKPLPVISNQKLNAYVREVCKLANIDEVITIVRFSGAKRIEVKYPKYDLVHIHTGRKTFATLSLQKGMSAEQVMQIGGWQEYKSFKRYINLDKEQTKEDMTKIWGEPARLKVV